MERRAFPGRDAIDIGGARSIIVFWCEAGKAMSVFGSSRGGLCSARVDAAISFSRRDPRIVTWNATHSQRRSEARLFLSFRHLLLPCTLRFPFSATRSPLFLAVS